MLGLRTSILTLFIFLPSMVPYGFYISGQGDTSMAMDENIGGAFGPHIYVSTHFTFPPDDGMRRLCTHAHNAVFQTRGREKVSRILPGNEKQIGSAVLF